MDRTAVALASSAITAVGADRLSVIMGRSPECLRTIEAKSAGVLIRAACGPEFGTSNLLYGRHTKMPSRA